VRVLIFHGYLLRGTGSNVYNAELAQALALLGHDVHLLCQDREAAELPWVNDLGRWRRGGLEVERLRDPESQGRITAYLPEIGGLLPVYVHDEYEGFEVKTYPELSDTELERYVEANAAAAADVAAGDVGAALANHLVAGPAILARARVGPYAVKVHGSDLSYTVRPHPNRFVPLAREGLEPASAALVGSLHTAEDLWATVGPGGLEERTLLGPPGVDTRTFRPRPANEATQGLGRLADTLRREQSDGAFGRDPAAAAAAISWFADAPAGRVLFVGKLLVNKGVDLLLAAWPLVVGEHPGARLLLTGFGAFRDGAERLWTAIERGDLDAARALAREGRALEGGGDTRPLRLLSAFLEDPPPDYAAAGRAAAGSVALSGRLEHAEVGDVAPAADALVMPSTFPEAFGMVAAEAAACGCLPVSAAHSGMAEVSRKLATVVDEDVALLLSFDTEADPVPAIAGRLAEWLSREPRERREIGAALSRRVGDLWSWDAVATGVVGAARGDLDALPRPG
jgi:glycosyltransferase involved in cell wall biosynthesis